MKKMLFVCLVCVLIIWSFGCAKKAAQVEPTPAKAAEVEKVEEQAVQTDSPTLSEDQIFEQKTIDALNREGALKRIHFDFDQYDVREDMKPLLQANADWLLKHRSVAFLIEGHCDERGTVEYNIALGEKRAEAARNYLASLGVNSARIKIVSYGKNRPLVAGVDEASYFQNRRAEFVITKK